MLYYLSRMRYKQRVHWLIFSQYVFVFVIVCFSLYNVWSGVFSLLLRFDTSSHER